MFIIAGSTLNTNKSSSSSSSTSVCDNFFFEKKIEDVNISGVVNFIVGVVNFVKDSYLNLSRKIRGTDGHPKQHTERRGSRRVGLF